MLVSTARVPLDSPLRAMHTLARTGQLLTMHADGHLYLRDRESLRVARAFGPHAVGLLACGVDEGALLAVDRAGVLTRWSLANGRVTSGVPLALEGRRGMVIHRSPDPAKTAPPPRALMAAFRPDGREVAVGPAPGPTSDFAGFEVIQLFDTRTGAPTRTLDWSSALPSPDLSEVRGMCWSEDGLFVAPGLDICCGEWGVMEHVNLHLSVWSMPDATDEAPALLLSERLDLLDMYDTADEPDLFALHVTPPGGHADRVLFRFEDELYSWLPGASALTRRGRCQHVRMACDGVGAYTIGVDAGDVLGLGLDPFASGYPWGGDPFETLALDHGPVTHLHLDPSSIWLTLASREALEVFYLDY